jgi:hypothetical protein
VPRLRTALAIGLGADRRMPRHDHPQGDPRSRPQSIPRLTPNEDGPDVAANGRRPRSEPPSSSSATRSHASAFEDMAGRKAKTKPQRGSTKPRPKLSPEIEERILTESRRRCAICYGLHGNIRRKKGQIAHLDHDRSNNTVGNLVFLCQPHHDEYDSTTSQSKGLTRREVARYLASLKAAVAAGFHGRIDAPTGPTPPLVVNFSAVGGSGGPGGFGGGGGGGGGVLGGAGGEGA